MYVTELSFLQTLPGISLTGSSPFCKRFIQFIHRDSLQCLNVQPQHALTRHEKRKKTNRSTPSPSVYLDSIGHPPPKPKQSPPQTSQDLPNKRMHPRPRMRSLQVRIQHSAHAALDRLDCPRQQCVQLLRRAGCCGPQVPAGGRLRDACVVGRGREGDVEVLVCGFGA